MDLNKTSDWNNFSYLVC